MLLVAPHPLLDLFALTAQLPSPLGALPTPEWLAALLRPEAESPLPKPDDALRGAIRDLLRHGGYKPTGRGKPASEYLARAAAEGSLRPINAAVDVGNVVSLHSGLPISVVDLDRACPPLRIAIAPAGASYVFNNAGHVIDVEGLLCLADAEGPAANAVKDAQRTKTTPETTRLLVVIWGANTVAGRAASAAGWARALLERLGATVADAPISR
jgi:DNA/RNA-binding domain of Phe-tRNA-synthetase-like protein